MPSGIITPASQTIRCYENNHWIIQRRKMTLNYEYPFSNSFLHPLLFFSFSSSLFVTIIPTDPLFFSKWETMKNRKRSKSWNYKGMNLRTKEYWQKNYFSHFSYANISSAQLNSENIRHTERFLFQQPKKQRKKRKS